MCLQLSLLARTARIIGVVLLPLKSSSLFYLLPLAGLGHVTRR
jgi:hypothetical protein